MQFSGLEKVLKNMSEQKSTQLLQFRKWANILQQNAGSEFIRSWIWWLEIWKRGRTAFREELRAEIDRRKQKRVDIFVKRSIFREKNTLIRKKILRPSVDFLDASRHVSSHAGDFSQVFNSISTYQFELRLEVCKKPLKNSRSEATWQSTQQHQPFHFDEVSAPARDGRRLELTRRKANRWRAHNFQLSAQAFR